MNELNERNYEWANKIITRTKHRILSFHVFYQLLHSRSKFRLVDGACFTFHRIEHRMCVMRLPWLQGQLPGTRVTFEGNADFTSCYFCALPFKRMFWKPWALTRVRRQELSQVRRDFLFLFGYQRNLRYCAAESHRTRQYRKEGVARAPRFRSELPQLCLQGTDTAPCTCWMLSRCIGSTG
jgi:hypothetical protein